MDIRNLTYDVKYIDGKEYKKLIKKPIIPSHIENRLSLEDIADLVLVNMINNHLKLSFNDSTYLKYDEETNTLSSKNPIKIQNQNLEDVGEVSFSVQIPNGKEHFNFRLTENYDIRSLNEEMKKVLNESKQYTITIITDRDRGSDGELTEDTFTANNDFEALLYVFQNYDLQNSAIADPELDDEDFVEAELDNRHKIMDAINTGENLEEGLEALKDAYFYMLDISDYYDNIVSLEDSDGHIVFEDGNIDVGEWFEDSDWDDEEDDEDNGIINLQPGVNALKDMLKTLPIETELRDRFDYRDRTDLKLWKENGEDWSTDFICNLNIYPNNKFGIWLPERGNSPKISKDGLSLEEVKEILLNRIKEQ